MSEPPGWRQVTAVITCIIVLFHILEKRFLVKQGGLSVCAQVFLGNSSSGFDDLCVKILFQSSL